MVGAASAPQAEAPSRPAAEALGEALLAFLGGDADMACKKARPPSEPISTTTLSDRHRNMLALLPKLPPKLPAS